MKVDAQVAKRYLSIQRREGGNRKFVKIEAVFEGRVLTRGEETREESGTRMMKCWRNVYEANIHTS